MGAVSSRALLRQAAIHRGHSAAARSPRRPRSTHVSRRRRRRRRRRLVVVSRRRRRRALFAIARGASCLRNAETETRKRRAGAGVSAVSSVDGRRVLTRAPTPGGHPQRSQRRRAFFPPTALDPRESSLSVSPSASPSPSPTPRALRDRPRSDLPPERRNRNSETARRRGGKRCELCGWAPRPRTRCYVRRLSTEVTAPPRVLLIGVARPTWVAVAVAVELRDAATPRVLRDRRRHDLPPEPKADPKEKR